MSARALCANAIAPGTIRGGTDREYGLTTPYPDPNRCRYATARPDTDRRAPYADPYISGYRRCRAATYTAAHAHGRAGPGPLGQISSRSPRRKVPRCEMQPPPSSALPPTRPLASAARDMFLVSPVPVIEADERIVAAPAPGEYVHGLRRMRSYVHRVMTERSGMGVLCTSRRAGSFTWDR